MTDLAALAAPPMPHLAPSPRHGEALRKVIEVLAPVLDDGQIAAWLHEPNCWLYGLSPADVVAAEPAMVLEAARGERFIARW